MSSVSSTALELQTRLQGLLSPTQAGAGSVGHLQTPPPSTTPLPSSDASPRTLRNTLIVVLCVGLLWIAFRRYISNAPIDERTMRSSSYDEYEEEEDENDFGGDGSDDPMFQRFSD